ncbi:MAG TPA: hypothetical protein VHX63_07850 [Acidobacteriaceae bacterium]|jgi:hypothetical protein|nr:hypothetical protein [Acidobacteriaceae bacterium]
MKKQIGFAVLSCLLFAGFSATNVSAQDQSAAVTPPPSVLVIMREFLKPGQQGSPHQKTESAFVQAFTAANWPEHYLAMDSLSGQPRALFFVGYDSFAAWEKDAQATQNNATLAAALDSAQTADGKLLTSDESSTFVYREDMSVNAPVDIPHMRYMEITRIKIRPGHGQEWDALSRLHNSIYGKLPNAHWAAYQDEYGANAGSVYIFISPLKSLAEIDGFRAAAKQLRSKISADDMKKMADLEASCFESIQTNLFMFNPKMSYVPEGWAKADPDFWGQK